VVTTFYIFYFKPFLLPFMDFFLLPYLNRRRLVSTAPPDWTSSFCLLILIVPSYLGIRRCWLLVLYGEVYRYFLGLAEGIRYVKVG
jgi:hypothetical protein